MRKMKRQLVALIAGAILMVALVSGTAFAADHSTPGTPGEPNCEGQTRAFLAQGAGGAIDAHGLGNVARAADLSVKEVQEIVRAGCGLPLRI